MNKHYLARPASFLERTTCDCNDPDAIRNNPRAAGFETLMNDAAAPSGHTVGRRAEWERTGDRVMPRLAYERGNRWGGTWGAGGATAAAAAEIRARSVEFSRG